MTIAETAPTRGMPKVGQTLSLLDTPISLTDAARLLGLSRQRVNQLQKAGYFRRLDHGLYDAADVVQGYARSLKDNQNQKSTAKADAEVALIKAQVRATEMRNARLDGELASVEETNFIIGSIMTHIIDLLNAIPPRFTRDLSERARLQKMIDTLRNDAADFCRKEGERLGTEAARTARRRS
jgi:phage terminase Nu1 subunit (DNA packaging protein)